MFAKFLPKMNARCAVQMKLAGVISSFLTPDMLFSCSFHEAGGLPGFLQLLSTAVQFCACSLPR